MRKGCEKGAIVSRPPSMSTSSSGGEDVPSPGNLLLGLPAAQRVDNQQLACDEKEVELKKRRAWSAGSTPLLRRAKF